MSFAFELMLIAFAAIVPFYMHAFFRFYGLVKTERPEWLNICGSFSFLSDGLTRIGDPNVQIQLLRVAFGPKARQLQSSLAISYAMRLRLLGCSAFGLFIVGLAGLLASAP